MQKKKCFTIPDETGNENIVIMYCDLTDLESVQKFCKDFLAKESSLHILINNAGKFNRITVRSHFPILIPMKCPITIIFLYIPMEPKSESEAE